MVSQSPFTNTLADIGKPVSSQPQVCVYLGSPRDNCDSIIRRMLCRVLCVLQQTAPMQVGGNRNARNCQLGPDGKRDWSFGLFDCFSRCNPCTWNRTNLRATFYIYADQLDTSLTVGCWSLWCPCVVYSYNRQRLQSLQNQGTPLPRGSESLDTYCCIYCGLDCIGFSWILQVCLGCSQDVLF